ncbi:MAG: ABC transporter ATP-binding protein [Hyphomicrobiales bacterium]|nr:ABC transporter ATP-binding protein/permease [Hyphomicrobiales bacterium]MDE2016707.1 ABC transporter ATP-binding protein [Hyphomicrobiales bacterium]
MAARSDAVGGGGRWRGWLVKSLHFEPTADAAIARLMRDYLRPNASRYAIAGALMVVSSASTAFSAWFLRDIVDTTLVDRNFEVTAGFGAVVLGIFAVRGAATYGQLVALGRAGNRIVADLQRRAFGRVLSLGIDQLSARSSSEAVLRAAGGAAAARDIMETALLGIGRDAASLVGLVVVMVVQAPILTVFVLLVGPPAFYLVSRLIKRVRGVLETEYAFSARVIQMLQEAVQGARIVKSFGLEDEMASRMEGAITALQARSNRITALQSRGGPIMETLAGMAIGAVLLSVPWGASLGVATPGAFVSFFASLLLANEPTRRLARVGLSLQPNVYSLRLLYELIDTEPSATETEGAESLDRCDGRVGFVRVGFSYPTSPIVLSDVTFEAAAGEKVALVGPSGAGKSTVFALLQRYYDPTAGAVTVDGRDVRSLTARSLRSHIAYVSQDAYMFAGTVRDNIRLGRLEATDAEVEAAARDAFAHDFIVSLRSGYDAQVGEGGGRLSGGQRQRIAIARAILKRAPILLLDEATSALDGESEHAVQTALDRLSVGRTTLVIAHRLSTVRNADRIVVLDGGRVVETGAHAELVLREGPYRRLYDRQFSEQENARFAKVG